MADQKYQVDGKPVLGFDSGLDARAFAQAKLARFITEPGLIVSGSHVDLWHASGVVEASNLDSKTMVVWGPYFEGERLDLLLYQNGRQDKALEAVARWIQAILTLDSDSQFPPPLWPCAAIIGAAPLGGPAGENGILFVPPSITMRCTMASDETARLSEKFIQPGLSGIDAAAFTAAAMLYRIFSGTLAFTNDNEFALHQDMKVGNFLPVRYAAPGLDTRLALLIQNALSPVEKRTGSAIKGITILGEIIAILQNGRKTVLAASLIVPLSEEEYLLLGKGKARFLKRQSATIRTKRFVIRNAAILTASVAIVVIGIIVGHNITKDRASLPSTVGMDPVQVIESYYYAFDDLDHQMMEACVLRGAGKSDISMVVNLFVVNKMRQSYERNNSPIMLSARVWKQGGGDSIDPQSFQVFGVTDLHIEQLSESTEQKAGSRNIDIHRYQVNYILWVPAAMALDETTAEVRAIDNSLPIPYHRSDLVMLVHQKKGWRISEIQRD